MAEKVIWLNQKEKLLKYEKEENHEKFKENVAVFIDLCYDI